MKADPKGTRSERARDDRGWKSPAQVRAEGGRSCCENCKYYWLKETPSRDGGASGNYLPYCGHRITAGESGDPTRQGARCDYWEMKP